MTGAIFLAGIAWVVYDYFSRWRSLFETPNAKSTARPPDRTHLG